MILTEKVPVLAKAIEKDKAESNSTVSSSSAPTTTKQDVEEDGFLFPFSFAEGTDSRLIIDKHELFIPFVGGG